VKQVGKRVRELEGELNSFDPAVRNFALSALLALVEEGVVTCPPLTSDSNLHCHSFHSYNTYGFSPSALAWIARREGIGLMGIVDFDLLDGVDEFLSACDQAGIHGTAGIETRVWLSDFSDRDINSPGEPGIAYMMGVGFTGTNPGITNRHTLELLRSGAQERNRDLVERINSRLPEVAIDYAQAVLPLSPSATPTERHIVQAFALRAEEADGDAAARWTETLKTPSPAVTPGTTASDPRFLNWLRARLVKQGGIGYLQPGPISFPQAEMFIHFVKESNALPCAAWLDGTSEGERDPDLLLDLLIEMGIEVVNVIPDRNWNVADPDERRGKVANLEAIVEAARRRAIPLIAGTEMNASGQRFIDDFNAPVLAPFRQIFTDGAWFVLGHSVLQQTAGLGWWSRWATHWFPERNDRIAFFTRLGQCLPPGPDGRLRLAELSSDPDPARLLALFSADGTEEVV